MYKREIKSIIEQCMKSNSDLTITRKKSIDNHELCGIPIAMSTNLLAFKYLYDFEQDGYMVIRMKDIVKVCHGDIEKYHNKILTSENIATKNPYENIAVNNWKTFFRYISTKINLINISEKLKNDPKYDGLIVGKIETIQDREIKIFEIDPLGKWKKEQTVVFYKNITSIHFNSRYSEMLYKYRNDMNIGFLN